MGLIVPGRNVACTKSVDCQFCGQGHATEGSIYMCEGVHDGGPHRIWCETDGCDGFVVLLKGKTCCYCACCFKPLDDGDQSLVQGEDENPYDIPAPTAPAEPVKEPA